MEPRMDAQSINLHWLLRLRWVAIAGQVAVILGVQLLLGIGIASPPVMWIIGFELLSNAACSIYARTPARVMAWMPAVILGVDVALLTALLHFTGGPMNPFSFLYMVHVALAAVTLPARTAWELTGLSLLGYASLFWLPGASASDAAMHAHHENMQLHLQGMYVAFAVAAAFIVYFVQHVTAALAERETELAAARSVAERHEKFAALTTLTAGAAHELSTPLSTIAVATAEIERVLDPQSSGGAILEDVRLIRTEVRRCREILERMAADAGPVLGEHLTRLPLTAVVDGALEGLSAGTRIAIEVDGSARNTVVEVPLRAVSQAVRGILKNAQQASPPAQPITVQLSAHRGFVRLAVCDRGAGMAPEVLEHAGEPFFTTKSPGEGMGLGLFLARTLMERLGGRLELVSNPGNGTTVTLVMPQRQNAVATS